MQTTTDKVNTDASDLDQEMIEMSAEVEREIIDMTKFVIANLPDNERRLLTDMTLESLTTDFQTIQIAEKIRSLVFNAVKTVYPHTTKGQVDAFLTSSMLKSANMLA